MVICCMGGKDGRQSCRSLARPLLAENRNHKRQQLPRGVG